MYSQWFFLSIFKKLYNQLYFFKAWIFSSFPKESLHSLSCAIPSPQQHTSVFWFYGLPVLVKHRKAVCPLCFVPFYVSVTSCYSTYTYLFINWKMLQSPSLWGHVHNSPVYTQRIQLVGSMVTQCFLFWGMTKLYTATSQVWRISVFTSLLVLVVAHHCECVCMCMHRIVSVCVPVDIYMEDMVSPSILFCFAIESISPLKWKAAILGTSLSKLLVSACFHPSMLGDWHAQLCLAFYVT